MTPDKINTMIPEIHAMKQERGEWDKLLTCGMCDLDPDWICSEEDDHDYILKERNAYLASKLDEITIDAAKAMEAYREGMRNGCEYGPRVKFQQETWGKCLNEDLPYIRRPFEIEILDRLEDLLASVAIRTMDLMGFYGVEQGKMWCKWPSPNNRTTIDLLRDIVNLSSGTLQSRIENIHHGKIIAYILRIAELEQIDLEWHINARKRYEFEGGE
jgi:hypothetical protein